MFRCPRCKAELPADATFCRYCGFNAPNASPPSGTSHAGRGSGQAVPPTPPLSQPGLPGPTRSIHVEHKHTLPTAQHSFYATQPVQAGQTTNQAMPATPPVPPASPPQPAASRPPVPSYYNTVPVAQPPHSSAPLDTGRQAGQQGAGSPAFPPQQPGAQASKSAAIQPTWGAAQAGSRPGQVSSPTPFVWGKQEPTAGIQPIEVVKGQAGVIQATSASGGVSESILATSKAAQRWRESWRERQHEEAGPATDVSRGQAAVPEPLLAMQHSIVRMRAIVLPKGNGRSRGATPGFWAAFLLMGCLILGLGAYIFFSYQPTTQPRLTANIASSSSAPALAVSGTPLASIPQGQILHLHGTNFDIGDPIIFSLDNAIPISGADGRQLTVTTDNQGAFDAAIPVATSWTPGAHMIEATDNRSGQVAYLNITVAVNGASTTTDAPLALQVQGKPVTQLNFTGVAGEDNPAGQRITLANTSNSPFTWTATAVTGNNLSWLLIDDGHTGNQIQANGFDSMGISVMLVSLPASTKPYTGQVIFTINTANSSQQLTLPVELLVKDAPAEMVFSPNPVVGILGAGGTCLPGTTLTLVNLGNGWITWNVNPDASAQGHIHFNGKPTLQGQLPPGATANLALTCINVQPGQSYHMTVSANGQSWSALVNIQTTT